MGKYRIAAFSILSASCIALAAQLNLPVRTIGGEEYYYRQVKKKETIYGHFLICYLSLFLLRVLEIKVFKNKINSYDLIYFMRDFRIVNKGDGSYINISRNQAVNEKVKELTALTNLDALFLSEKEVENIFQNCMLLDS